MSNLYHSFRKSQRIALRQGSVAICVALVSGLMIPAVQAVLVTNPAFSISTYISSLPVNNAPIAGLAINPATRELFYLDSASNPLHRINADKTVTTLGNLGNVGYPYVSTDIQYASGNVYMAYGSLNSTSATAAGAVTTTSLASGYTIESGIARVGNLLYVTGGASGSGLVRSFDLTTGTVATPAFSVPTNASSLEYDAVHNRLIGAINNDNDGNTSFYAVDLVTNLTSAIPGGLSSSNGNAFGNFAVDQLGVSIYTRQGNAIQQKIIATGATTAFVTGLSDSIAYDDLVFGPSSSGLGQSLYVADGTSILEVSGFTVPEPAFCAVIASAVGIVFTRRRRA